MLGRNVIFGIVRVEYTRRQIIFDHEETVNANRTNPLSFQFPILVGELNEVVTWTKKYHQNKKV